MYEDVLEIHKRIHFGEPITFSPQNNRSVLSHQLDNSGNDATKKEISKLKLDVYGEDKKTVDKLDYKKFETVKQDHDTKLQDLSQELEFYSRRYGGDSL